MSTWFKGVVAGVLTLAAALLGGWDLALQGLIFFMVADYLSAVIRSAMTRSWSSSVGIRGFWRKLGQLLAVAVAHGMDVYVFSGTPWARTMAAAIFMLNEAGSTLANLAAIGVPLPAAISQALQAEIARKRGDPA